MEKYDDEDGVWRTIRGRRVFIREGESLGSAMSRSGKFKKEKISTKNDNDEVNKRSKIKKLVKRGNTYIPIRENEDEKERLREYKKSNNKDRIERIKSEQKKEELLQRGVAQGFGEEARQEVKQAQERKGRLLEYKSKDELDRNDPEFRKKALNKLGNFLQDNRELIDKWQKEYDNTKRNRDVTMKKLLNHEKVSLKELVGFAHAGPFPGDIILAGGENGEDVRVGENGELIPLSRRKEIEKFKAKKRSNRR